MNVTLLVIAKEPVPGRVKTRLCPPCTLRQSAALAAAALADTLVTVARAPAARRVLVLEGRPGPWAPAGFEVIPQAGGGLADRLAAAFAAVEGPALLVGMDTPQLSPSLLRKAAATLLEPGTDAVLGPALDGGYWAIGLRRRAAEAFEGVPMSSELTLAAQRARLDALGLVRRELTPLRDVDTFADAVSVAAACPPRSRFRAALAATEVAGSQPRAIAGRPQWAAA